MLVHADALTHIVDVIARRAAARCRRVQMMEEDDPVDPRASVIDGAPSGSVIALFSVDCEVEARDAIEIGGHFERTGDMGRDPATIAVSAVQVGHSAALGKVKPGTAVRQRQRKSDCTLIADKRSASAAPPSSALEGAIRTVSHILIGSKQGRTCHSVDLKPYGHDLCRIF